MAGTGLIATSRWPVGAGGAGGGGDGTDDVWQGYGVRWTDTGLEITARTSRVYMGSFWIGAAAGLFVGVWGIYNASAIDPAVSPANPVVWLGALLAAALVTLLVGAPFCALAAACGLRSWKQEWLEIRPDGITLNRRTYFPHSWIHRIEVERLPGDLSDHPWAVIGIIGTRKLTLLAGFDDPTAEVIGAAIEKAKRQLWQDAG